MLKIDCGEFQMEHEVAKLIGAPPGYLGHRETQPMLTQQKLSTVASESSSLSLVLFDEIEKAAPTHDPPDAGNAGQGGAAAGRQHHRRLRAQPDLPHQQSGAEAMREEIAPDFGFSGLVPRTKVDNGKLGAIGLGGVNAASLRNSSIASMR